MFKFWHVKGIWVIFLIFSLNFNSAISQNLIITEFFADPTPSKGLPEVEFIELFNKGDSTIINLNFKLSIGSNDLNGFIKSLKKNEALILCKSENSEKLKPYGQVLGFEKFTLRNEGETIRLSYKDFLQIIDFDKSWYSDKYDEGYSLEILNPKYICKGSENWGSNLNNKGASPGIYIPKEPNDDFLGPNLLKTIKVGNKITLTFSEKIDSLEFKTNGLLILNKQAVSKKEIKFNPKKTNVIEFIMPTNLTSLPEINVDLSGIQDCLGNKSKDIKFTIFNTSTPQKGDISISEVLFEATDDKPEFLEFHNISKKVFDFSELYINLKENDRKSFKKISISNLLFKPNTFVAFTKDTSKYSGLSNVYFGPNIPQLTNSGGEIFIYNKDSLLIDKFIFSNKLHSKFISNTAGVSVEKINQKDFSYNSSNYTSAAGKIDFHTAGKPNSVQENPNIGIYFEVKNKIINRNDPNQSNYILSYFLDDPNYLLNTKIFDRNRTVIKTLNKSFLAGTLGEIRWDGSADKNITLSPNLYYLEVELLSLKKQKIYRFPVVVY